MLAVEAAKCQICPEAAWSDHQVQQHWLCLSKLCQLIWKELLDCTGKDKEVTEHS